MSKTAIVVDSTSYLTSTILDQYQIQVVPLSVNIGTESFLETELSNKTLFAKLKSIQGFSTTSQPAVGAFVEKYEDLFKAGYEDIISIHLSNAISGTISSAQMAKELVAKPSSIHILDSGSAALGLGLMAWAAGEWAREGYSAEEILGGLAKVKSQTEFYFIVDTLDNLHRGGRIGGASALIGTLLQIKPILYFNERGEIDVYDKVRSQIKAWQRVKDELKRAVSSGKTYRICVQHVGIPEEGQRIVEELQGNFPGHDIRLFEAGPVIATHVGPGAFGLVYHPWPLSD